MFPNPYPYKKRLRPKDGGGVEADDATRYTFESYELLGQGSPRLAANPLILQVLYAIYCV